MSGAHQASILVTGRMFCALFAVCIIVEYKAALKHAIETYLYVLLVVIAVLKDLRKKGSFSSFNCV